MPAHEEVDALVSAAIRDGGRDTLGPAIRALDASEVFYRANVSATEEGQRVTTPLVRLSDGSHALVVYTSKNHPDLPRKFGGAPWRHVLKMVEGMPKADWLIVSIKNGEWLPIAKEQVKVIIKGLEASQRPEAQESYSTKQPINEGLEKSISEAVNAPSENWSDDLKNLLQGRELFVRIATNLSKEGRPVMVTSQVGDIRGLVQVYTSRKRPDITYGGMTWEEIVSMVRNEPEIPGVHVINDHDDWVVMGRSEL